MTPVSSSRCTRCRTAPPTGDRLPDAGVREAAVLLELLDDGPVDVVGDLEPLHQLVLIITCLSSVYASIE